MKPTRREFIEKAVAGGAMLGLSSLLPAKRVLAQTTQPAAGKLKLLILGGTGFLGPHVVETAVARGHAMTLFNRGKTNPQLFPGLEKLVGDRYGDITALKGRKWDAIIDTFAYVPKVVTDAAELLRDNIKQYVLISSISVYAKIDKPGMDETAPVGTVSPEVVEKTKTHREVTGESYGPLKALCEQAAEKAMPGRVANIRPGLIVGPGDPSDRFTYWPVRIARGGEVLCPGSENDFTQFIDVRDLAEFIITCIERNTVGVFNADAPEGSITMGRFLAACKQESKSDAKLTWVPTEFLEKQGVQPWSDMPAWSPPLGDEKGFGQVSTERARKAGLKNRPIAQTVRATLEWWNQQPEDRRKELRAGIKAEREKEVLAAWHEASKNPGT